MLLAPRESEADKVLWSEVAELIARHGTREDVEYGDTGRREKANGKFSMRKKSVIVHRMLTQHTVTG